MSFLRMMAVVFGVALLAVGIMGFIPMFIINGNFLGIFEVNNIHNAVHLASGALALLCSFQVHIARLYFRIFGIVYALVAIAGFAHSGDLMVMHMNMADNILHTVIALISLWLGFIYKEKTTA